MGTQAMPSLKDGTNPFIVVNLRIKKADTDVRTDKTVIRLGTEVEYQVFIAIHISFSMPIQIQRVYFVVNSGFYN